MINLPKTENILLEQDAGWLTIWFNRPDNRNALSKELTTELKEVLNAVRDKKNIRGITLRGKGGVFCAGGDLKGFKNNYQGGSQTVEDIAAASRQGGQMFDLINELRSLSQGIAWFDYKFDRLQEFSGKEADDVVAHRAEAN